MAVRNGFGTMLSAENPHGADRLAVELGERGFDCVISIGEAEEIEIGSNCGQAATRIVRGKLHGERHAVARRVG
jgi:hypothetical protein